MKEKTAVPNPFLTEFRAYYFTLQATGDPKIDRILAAIASAGKCYHHTDQWREEPGYAPDGQEGKSPVEWIQNAADAAAEVKP